MGAGDESGGIIDRFYAALCSGDVAGARACCAPDVRFWHSFDGVAQELEAASWQWEEQARTFPESGIADVRRMRGQDERFVQQHVFWIRTEAGDRLGWPVCMIVEVRDALIARLDEYVDRAGSHPIASEEIRTPGLPRAATA
jgi:ketosteroid isomerase-like protein